MADWQHHLDYLGVGPFTAWLAIGDRARNLPEHAGELFVPEDDEMPTLSISWSELVLT